MDTFINALVAVGTLALASLSVWGDWIRNRLACPKIRLEEHNFRGEVTSVLRQVPGRAPQALKGIYYHLRVTNRRKWATVRECRVLLIGIEREDASGRFVPESHYVYPQFIWAPAELSPILMTFSEYAVLDFGHIIEGEDTWQPALYTLPYSFKGFVTKDTRVRYKLRVEAANMVPSDTFTIEVSWNGKFSDNLDAMARNLVIHFVNP